MANVADDKGGEHKEETNHREGSSRAYRLWGRWTRRSRGEGQVSSELLPHALHYPSLQLPPFLTYSILSLVIFSADSTLNQTTPLEGPHPSPADTSPSQPRHFYLTPSLPPLFLLSTLCPLCEPTPSLPNPALSPKTLLLPVPLP